MGFEKQQVVQGGPFSPIKIYEKRLLQTKSRHEEFQQLQSYVFMAMLTKKSSNSSTTKNRSDKEPRILIASADPSGVSRQLVGYEAPKKSHNLHVDPVMNLMDLVGDLVN